MSLLLATQLLSTALWTPGAAAEPASGGEMPAACRGALDSARELIEISKETITIEEGIHLVQDVAGATCGFDFYNGTLPSWSVQASHGFPVDCLDRSILDNAIGGGQRAQAAGCEDSPANLPPVNLGVLDTVPCALPGSGPGRINAEILGTVLDQQPAVGEWKPVEGVQEVFGDGGTVGGIQTGNLGLVFVAALGLPASGSSGATCLEETTAVIHEAECWWLVFWMECTQEIRMQTRLVACSGWSEQDLLSLVKLDHEYKTTACL